MLDTVIAPAEWQRLAGLLNDLGEALAPLPDLDFAALVIAAVQCWHAGNPATTADPVLRDVASRGRRLAETYRCGSPYFAT